VFKNPPGKREVTSLCLGGPSGAKDRVYAAFGQTISGINKKKGQSFFTYSTALNEEINEMYVEDLTIITACEFSLNVFEASKNGETVNDVHFYMSPDKIQHMAILRLDGATTPTPTGYGALLACQDKHLRLVRESKMLSEARVDGPVMAVQVYDGSNHPADKKSAADPRALKTNQDYKQAIYGTDNGLVGQYFLASDGSRMNPGFILGKNAKKSGVTSLALCDVTLSGSEDIVVGRDDGTLEVFEYEAAQAFGQPPESGEELPQPEPVFRRELNESITTVTKGQVIANNSNDLVASTYAGKVLAYTHELKHSAVSHISLRSSAQSGGEGGGGGLLSSSSMTSPGLPGTIVGVDGSSTNVLKESKQDLDRALKEMRMELERLSQQVAREKEKYATKIASSELIAVEQQFKLKTNFSLVPDEASYTLTVEIDIPIDCIALQSAIPVMLLDAKDNSQGSAGVVLSRSERDTRNGNETLAVYTVPPENSSVTRIEIQLRTVEGQHGNLNLFVIPKLQPKTCQRTEVSIKPLSLHEKVEKETIDRELNTRPLNTLTITGSFTLADMHAWISFCLPDVSVKLLDASPVPSPSSSASSSTSTPTPTHSLYFRSTFLKTILTVDYSKGKAVFRSDNLTSLSIVKEVMTKEATSQRINIGIDVDLKANESIDVFLNLLRPELDAYFTLAKKQELIAPLKEIATHELGAAVASVAGESAGSSTNVNIAERLDELRSCMSEEYLSILRDADRIESKLKASPRHLDFLRGIVTDLFVDKSKLQGKSAQSRVPILLEILEKNYEFDKLLAAFKEG